MKSVPCFQMRFWVIALIFLPLLCLADSYVPEKSNRTEIKLDDTPWKFIREDHFPDAESPSFDDSSWKDVGVPHCFNDGDSFVNANKGLMGMFQGTVWYRKHFSIPAGLQGKKAFIEFEGVNIACAVYINGHFMPTNSLVKQPGEVTHVFGFVPFVLDVTSYVHFGGAENVMSVRVTNNEKENWYSRIGFGTGLPFGMGYGGIFRPVHLYITDPVHVPLNVYSNVNNWGTNVATLTADANSASVQIQTNVQNDASANSDVDLETKVVDEDGNVVMDLKDHSSVAAGTTHMFDQKGTVARPHLWHPNNGDGSAQYIYKVYSIVRAGGSTVDVFQSPLGIRTITWDNDYPYFNGVKYDLYGFGARYDYPALGSAVPEEQQWRDVKIGADCGGALLRPGHNPSSIETVDACDYYGVTLAQPSGDNEFSFSARFGGPIRDEYKNEFQRDVIVRDRNHPSIAFWEASNGGIQPGFLPELKHVTDTWDNLMPRELAPRGTFNYPNPIKNWDFQADLASVKVVGACYDGIKTKEAFPDHPVWTAESWILSASRFDWDRSIVKAETYVKKVQDSKQAKLFGFAQWYLNETAGENLNKNAVSRTLNCSAVDGNRIPELIYKVYKNAVLIPYAIKPGVVLGGNWNLSGTVEVKAWSNCPQVKLYLNGKDLGVQTPEAPFADHPFRATWQVPWESGTLKAVGLDASGKEVCSDQLVTAGPADHLELSVEPELQKPDGSTFAIKANGTDAAFILAKIVDKDGNVCPDASPPITFSVSGPGNYRGSWNQTVYAGKPLNYHAPGDPELDAEAGLMKVAVRSTFAPGTVTVTAASPNLTSATATFTTVPVSLDTP